MTNGCILCAHDNDLPEGEYCRACGEGFENVVKNLEGAELDAFLRSEGLNPDELLSQFDSIFEAPGGPLAVSSNTSKDHP
jgi:hypothetical protein